MALEPILRLNFIIDDINLKIAAKNQIEIITPPKDRGCQLSLIIRNNGKKIHDFISEKGVISDWRHPDVIRVAPVPLYNNFEDVFRFGVLLEEAVNNN